MDAKRWSLTWWAATLTDPDQEQRFKQDSLTGGRFAALAALTTILVMLVAVYSALAATGSIRRSAAGMGSVALLVVLGAATVGALARARRPATIFGTMITAVALVTAAVSLFLAGGLASGAPGAIMVFGGVVIVYLSVPTPSATAAVSSAALFSAVTIPTYLWFVDGTSAVDVSFTLSAAGMAHVLGPIDAWRKQRERRIRFAQTEVLEQLSTMDALTKLANRRAITIEFDRAWRSWQAAQRPLSVLMIDIDHFKYLNDAFGHLVGDQSLKQVARAIRVGTRTRAGSICGRYGGEEFLCVLPGMTISDAAQVAEDIRRAVHAAKIPSGDPTSGAPATVTVSIGVASARPGMLQARELTDLADRQLYRAKNAGRDCVWVARESDSTDT